METKTVTCKAFTKAVDVENRTVEQIVSVFGNVDLGKDRVIAGAFAKSLDEWNASDDVLSAYFSHQWEDPFANLGGVIESAELLPGDSRLPNDRVVTEDGKTLRELGGLLVKYQFDPEGKNPFADQVFWLLSERRITQASFAYDVVDSKRNSDGTTDLLELKLHEVGPTLLGMNPATTLLASSRKSIIELAEMSGLSEEQVQSVMEAASKSAVETTESEAAAKSAVSFVGSIEERQSQIAELASGWAEDSNVANGGLFACYLEATFSDRAVFMVEGWDDPYGQGKYFEASIVDNDDGTISLGDPTEVVIEQSTRPKSFASSSACDLVHVMHARKQQTTAKRKEAATLSNQDEGAITDQVTSEARKGNEKGTTPEVKTTSEDNAGEAERLRMEAEFLLLEV